MSDCIHVSYSEQAGGFLICDDCGKDVTAEVVRRENLELDDDSIPF